MAERAGLTQKLLLAYTARQDFITAIGLTQQIQDPKLIEPARLKIARAQAQAGLAPLRPPVYFLAVPEDRIADPKIHNGRDNDFYQDIALLQAEIGDVNGAIKTAEMTHRFPWFLISLGKTIAGQGVDAVSLFNEIYTKSRVGDCEGITRVGQAAEAQRELGVTPSKSIIDRFREARIEEDSYSCLSYALRLAKAYALAGYPQEALDIWEKTRSDGLPDRPEALSIIAISFSREHIDPKDIVSRIIEETEALKPIPQYRYHPTGRQVEIYANLSRAYSLYGLDPQLMIDRALEKEKLERVEEENIITSSADSLVTIAKAQIANGGNARPTLLKALEIADNIVKSDESDDGYGRVFQIMGWEDIAESQITGGFLDDARITAGRLDRHSEIDGYADISSDKAEVMAKLASAEARKGLSAKEIEDLPVEDVKMILSGGDEKVRRVLEYFNKTLS